MKKSLLFILILLGVLSLHAQDYKHHKITIDMDADVESILTQLNPVSVLICPGTHTFTLGAVTGGSGTISYTWQMSYDNEIWSNVQGPNTTQDYTTPTLGWGTVNYFRRVATMGSCSTTSNSAAVTVVPLPPRPEFMAYNLGADSTITDPKLQMAYLSTQTNQLDGHVFGGWYQWGRKPVDYAINPSTYLRYNGSGAANHTVAWASTMVPDGDGQLPGQDDYHVYSTSANNYDWSVPPNNSLWGNGEAIFTPTSGVGAVLHTDGNYYQKPVKTVNDPCPSGYRLPTQNDWELMGNYDCNPTADVVNLSTSSLITKPANNSGLTWVNVACDGGDCTVSNSWGSAGSSPWGGYAIYETSVWEAAPVAAGGSLIAAGAPQPLLFLPAAGSRLYNSGFLNYVGTIGSYWSSSINFIFTEAYSLALYSTYIHPSSINYRAYASSIRCVKCAIGEDCYVPEP